MKKESVAIIEALILFILILLLLIIYLSVIETLISSKEMSIIRSTSFGFAQNTIHDFQNTILNSKWHCLQQMPQKHVICLQYFRPARVAQW